MEVNKEDPKNLLNQLAKISDPRRRRVKHPLVNILMIALCAMVAGCDDFVSMAMFGKAHREWFKKYLNLSGGIPSHDRINAVISAIAPEEFERCLVEWITAVQEITKGQVIAIDGKTLRRSFDKATGKKAIHMVGAWATANKISLGQVVTDEKSNEITAIPKLLKMLELEGFLVTIDAMGCQTEIAEQIVDKGGDYVLNVKGNQSALQNEICNYFIKAKENPDSGIRIDQFEKSETGHGREENRAYFVTDIPLDFNQASRWKNLKAIGIVKTNMIRDGKKTEEIRFYIMSRSLSVHQFADAVRSHWDIENQLHWQLDVSYGEDACRVRKKNGDINLAHLRRITLAKLKNEKTEKVGIKNKRLLAGWDPGYGFKVLFDA